MDIKDIRNMLLDLEGRRIAFIKAAEFLGEEFIAGSNDEPRQKAGSERMFDTQVPEDSFLLVIDELREKADELKAEYDRIEAILLEAGEELRRGIEESYNRARNSLIPEMPDLSDLNFEDMDAETLHKLRVITNSGGQS